MASTRLHRVEELLRREIARVIVHGGLRDPRLQPSAAISITAVKVAADLGSARVYVDVLDDIARQQKVVAALNASAAHVRSSIASQVQMKRVPRISFFRDDSIENGAAIERVLAELRDEAAEASRVSQPRAEVGHATEAGAPEAGDAEVDPAKRIDPSRRDDDR